MEHYKIYGVEIKTRLYIGYYLDWYTVNGDKYYTFIDVIEKIKPKPICSVFVCTSRKIKRYDYLDFCSKNIVYDLEEIRENGQRARKAMEKRSLDIILKRLVNETFEW